MAIGMFDGPIPGENYTSDTKNYPWHRPPQFTSMNEAFEYIVEQIAEEDVSSSIITMLEIGVPVSRLVDMLITAGIGGGKFTVDYGLLMAGPLSHVICLMARRLDVEVDLGISRKNKPPTKAFFDALQRSENSDEAGSVGGEIASGMGLGGAIPSAPQEPVPPQPAASGLMGASPAPAAPPATGLAGAPAPEAAPAPQEQAPPAPEEGMM